MLDVLYRYENGFVFIPVMLSCKRAGVFEHLGRTPAGMPERELVAATNANEGHLAIALDMLQTLGWIDRTPDGRLLLTATGTAYREVPEAILEIYRIDGATFLPALSTGALRPWLDQCRARWPENSAAMRDFLDGVVLVPLFVALARHDLLDRLEDQTPPDGVTAADIDAVRGLFADLDLGRFDGSRFSLAPSGKFLLQRALFHGVPVSYQPMLRQMDALLFGDAAGVFGTGPDGHERHLDRALNVIASGDQHETYFAEMQSMVVAYLDSLPLDRQPRYIVDMGCGDGTLLRLLYSAVVERSERGRHLDSHPLTMVGVDFNPAALEETAHTLVDVPHLLLTGDIADPSRMMVDLAAQGVTESDGILHVRSFLDHDRVFQAPESRVAADLLGRLPLHGRYVDRAGRAIPASDAVASLVEHFTRWGEVVSHHGLGVIEVHCLGMATSRRYLELTNSFHFQALQGFSGQQLVEADSFLMAAAQAGLLPDPALSRRYPRAFPFTHITLNWLRKAPFRIRYATPADLPLLLDLESACWAAPMRTPEAVIQRRLDACPEGCLVLEHQGLLTGVIYSQRIERVEDLEHIKIGALGDLHRPDGPVAHILGLNVLPEMQHLALGDRLLAFFLHLCSLRGGIERAAGITRCRNAAEHPDLRLEEYIQACDADGRPIDPILHFHVSHGARVRCLVPGYRPEDTDNQGAGVLIEYNRLHGGLADSAAETEADAPRATTTTTPEWVEEQMGACLAQVLDREADAIPFELPLMELGLDSLQLLELRMLLSARLDVRIEPTVFFDHPSPRALSAWLVERLTRPADQPGAAPRRAAPVTVPISPSVAVNEPEDQADDANRFAIVGMACRFPGGADTPEGYWRLLTSGSDAITEMPDERRELLGLAADDPLTRRRGGYLSGIDGFDAGFFHIPAAEADALDPQHRLLLEIAWESLEDAGIDPTSLAETSAGLFVGLFSHDYELLQVKQGNAGSLGAWLPTGNAAAMAAGRLAYFLGLRGPALTLDTACSSSLVAVHLACNSLRNGESELALALGANLLLTAELTEAFDKAGMLAPDGHCKTFSAEADGYVRSEGAAALVIKRLDRAKADGDRILAVIRGSAMNQDGASNGLTAPNGRAQQAVQRNALAAAGCSPEEVSYLELHGTGTPLGDPVEFEAIREVYAPTRRAPLMLGSVKTVVGHTEAVAGLAGLMKVVLAFRHRTIPPHLHLGELNPHIDLGALPAEVPVAPTEWSAPSDTPRVAGVSSFGFSGTNAHVILCEAPTPAQPVVNSERSYHVLALSARGDSALRASAGRLAAWLAEHPESNPADLAYSLNVGRTRFKARAAWGFDSIASLGERLAAFAVGAGDPPPAGNGTNRPKIAFLFTGQGSQYLDMARTLYEGQPVFRKCLDRCAEHLEPHLPRPLLEVLFEDAAALGQTGFAQPALFSIEMALVALLRDWGVAPDLVLGHSVGEYAAACCAGVFGLEDGLRLIAGRGRLMQGLPSGGAMAALSCGAEQAMDFVTGIDQVGLAADNGSQTVISGPATGVDEALKRATDAGINGQRLTVSHAFHSALLEPMLDDLARLAGEIEFNPPRLTLISNLTGKPVDAENPLDAGYWRRHSREPVRFGASVRSLAEAGCDLLIEIGPNPVLMPLTQRAWPTGTPLPRFAATLRRGVDEWRQIAETLASCHAAGATIDWRAWDRPWPRRRVSPPTYPFQRNRHWIGAPDQPPTPQATGTVAASPPRDTILDRLRAALPEQRGAMVAEYVRRKVTESMIDAPAQLDPMTGFFDLGMDSLMAVGLYNRLDLDLRDACDIEPTVVFDYPTLDGLTRHIAELLLDIPGAPAVKELETQADDGDAVAIIGLGCRFPGANDPEAFWDMLMAGHDPIGRVPSMRWDADAWFDPDPDAPGRMWTREGGFLDDIAGFDAAFFGIAPREAPSMDPQHRLLLEVSWEALERSGIVPASLAGSRTGVFVGICGNEYTQVIQSGGAEAIDAYFGVGYAMSAAAGRLAYTLGLQGPALSIDTACSSSLVAVHQACRALDEGACDLALAAGVNLILNPLLNVSLTKARMLAQDGRCKTFSDAADGYGRSDGCGVVVLRRLADARRDGDPILAIVRGSAVNQDGRSGGLTVPNGPAQEAVIRAALARARVKPAEVGYVEAHGTGTSLGDPIEVQALANVYGEGRAEGQAIRVGAVKSNIGHLEAAAGIAGLIKLVLALGKGHLPGQLHYRNPNPIIPWQRLPVRVMAESSAWDDTRRIGGVSSFGFTGTNAHVVVEQAPAVEAAPKRSNDAGPHLLCLSARGLPALKALVTRWLNWLDINREVDIDDLCHTAAVRRGHWEERLAVVADSTIGLRDRLRAWLASDTAAGVHTGQVPPDGAVELGGNLVALPIEQRAALYVLGANAEACVQAGNGQLIPLPPYPFQRKHYWIGNPAWSPAPGSAPEVQAAPESAPGLELPTGQTLFRRVLDPRRQTWLGEHRVDGQLIVPGAWTAAVALDAFGASAVLADLVLRQPVVLDPDKARDIQLILSPPAENGWRDFELYAAKTEPPHAWMLHATGRVGMSTGQTTEAAGRPPMQPAATATAETFYAERAECGLVYGPAFRAIQALDFNDSQATAVVEMPAGVEAAPHCAVHPALLDACLQVAAAAGGPTPRPLLPFAIERMDLPAIFPDRFICRAVVRPNQHDRSRVADLELTDTRGQHLGRVTGLICRPLGTQTDSLESRVADSLYHTVWHDAPLVSSSPPYGFPPPEALRSAIPSDLPSQDRAAQSGIQGLETLALGYIINAFAALGCPLKPGLRFAAADLADTLQIVPTHGRLWQRLISVLASVGIIEAQGAAWSVPREPTASALEPVIAGATTEVVLLDRCGRALADVLRGRIDPLALLFPRDGSPGAENLYRESATVLALHRCAAEVVAKALADLPADRPLRVLEIGAGTGGATNLILPQLAGRAVAYAFTDLSASFFDNAGKRFAEFPFVTYQTLDIERDPAGQGFLPGEWDIVIAANVLHATRDLPEVLAHTRGLLAPHGLLLMQEAVRARAWLDLVFGLLPGWWHFADDLRDDGPLLSASAWQGALQRAGFPEATALVPPDADGDQALIVARAGASAKRRRSWLVLSDSGDVGTELMAQLSANGEHCIQLDPDQSAEALKQRILGVGSLDGVVFLGALDIPAETNGDEVPAAALRKANSAALNLIRALATTGTSLPAGLWLITRGTQSVLSDSALNPWQAPLWGMAKVAGIEHPELRCHRLDLASRPEAGEVRLLAAELTAGLADEEVALRGAQRLRARLEPIPATASTAELAIEPDGTYLISGGLGGLGLETARWLVERGARHLALCGRSSPDAAANARLDALARQGVEIRVFSADVARADAVARMLDKITAEMPALRGIFHAAGVLDDGALVNQNWARFEKVFGPKLDGAWNLHRMTLGQPLELFVLYSSTAALVGSPGQANHAAANSFLDVLAHLRRRHGLTGASINWSGWADIGAAARPDVERRLATQGVEMISPALGIAALETILAADLTQAGVLPPRRDTAPSSVGPEPARPEPLRPTDSLRLELDSAPGEQRPGLLTQALQAIVARALRLGAPEELDPRIGFFELGMDSLMSLEIRARIQEQLVLDQPLAVTALFDHPNIERLVAFLLQHLWPAPALPATTPDKDSYPDALIAEISGLSDAELEQIIAEESLRMLASDNHPTTDLRPPGGSSQPDSKVNEST